MVSETEIEKLCKLADLSLTSEEKKNTKTHLEVVLNAFRELQEVDTTGVEPMYQIKDSIDFRKDVPSNQLKSEKFLKNVCSEVDNYIEISQVVAND
jgi:aspartyl-tRNA(Asn)/glutamyl-tRNA(Gln) amidotransferase subunit C